MKRNMVSVILAASMLAMTMGGAAAAEDAGASGSVEIMSWWTGGGEAEALNAIVEGFQEKNAGVEVINSAVAGSGGTNAQAVLATRMAGGDPPDVFQANGGYDTLQWTEGDQILPLDDLFEANGWNELLPEKIVQMNTKDGHVYGVPINIGRDNMIWYNKKVFEENNITPPTTWDEFFEAAEALKGAGITPLALGDSNPTWATLIFEEVLLAQAGVEGHDKVFQGELSMDSEEVRQAAETFNKLLDYVNENHSALDWQDAAQLVVDGDAAMLAMGDWAAGFFQSVNMEPDVDFGWFEAPGTTEYFLAEFDAFLVPAQAKNTEGGKAFAEFTIDPVAQTGVSIHKGSIPARVDIEADSFESGAYVASAMEDFKTLEIVPSLIGKAIAPAGFFSKFNECINILVNGRDVDQFISMAKDTESLLQ